MVRDTLSFKKIAVFYCDSNYVVTHSHNFLEMVYVTSGKARHIWDGHISEISKGDYFIIDYRSEHSYSAITADFEVVDCLFLPEFIDASLIHCRSIHDLINSYPLLFDTESFAPLSEGTCFKDTDGKILGLINTMVDECKQENPGYLHIVRSCLIEILVFAMRSITKPGSIISSPTRIEEIIKYIHIHFMDRITLEDLCTIYGYSVPHLSQLFNKKLGVPYSKYVQKIRMDHATRLLSSTDMSIDDIALAVGYRDLKAFYTVFKKYVNTTPANFRRKFKAKTMIF